MPKRSSKRGLPKDLNQLAKWIAEVSTDGKDAAAVYLGKKGGMKGGPARAAKLSAEARSRIAQSAAYARWKKAKTR
ncbi:MAG TPA: hypothetical protein DDX89_06090 [Candidatus Omnitrophica bacterium]|nr:hypothetical protein [Candidatus Omnitrophota bacterium]